MKSTTTNAKTKSQRRPAPVGRAIRVRRESMKLSRDQLAVSARVPSPSLMKIETGRTRDMVDANLDRIANALGTTSERLRAGKAD